MKKTIFKTFALALGLVTAISLAACSNPNDPENPDDPNNPTPEVPAEDAQKPVTGIDPVFTDPVNAAFFKHHIKDFYASHFLKSAYTSAIAIDDSARTITRGKSAIPGVKWNGAGLDMTSMQQQVFG